MRAQYPMVGDWLRAPRQLRLVFLAVMLLLTATLGWLGFQLVAQDRELSEKRLDDQRETAADLAVVELKTRISAIEQDLSVILAGGSPKELAPTRSAVFFQLQSGSIRTWPERGLIFYPELPDPPEVSSELFAVADESVGRRDYSGAIEILSKMASAGDPIIRGAALARVAGARLESGQLQQSLRTYQQIAGLEGVAVNGTPAAFAGRLGFLAVFERQNDRRSLEAEATALYRDLNSGRWPIDSGVYDSLSAKVREILPQLEEDKEAQPVVALAEGVYGLWKRWKPGSSSLASGQSSVSTPSGPVLLVWRTLGDRVAGFAATAGHLESAWLAELKARLEERHVGIVLTDREGNVIAGPLGDSNPTAIRLTGDLPWAVRAFNTGSEVDTSGHSQTLLLAVMAVLVTLILTGAWFIGHAVSRELAVARLQSDFVSAVSHEFRTPLTTLCQLSELLRRGRVANEVDRLQYYELLDHGSHRLRRLVESLLNFGRLESGQLQFRFEELDAAALVRQSTEEFARERQAHGYRFEIETGAEAVPVRADRDTLQCVFWNLLENAVKYSPGCDTVWVDVARNNGLVEIAVRDRGAGIPLKEQRRVFEKFVRGSAARSSDVHGTGIGLAMARQIVRAHGGDITLESDLGRGSTFRVALPVVQTARNG
jgi:signal transduction histidine kinase